MWRLVITLVGGAIGAVLLPILFTLAHAAYVLHFEPERGMGPAHHDPFWDYGPFINRTAIAAMIGLVIGLLTGAWIGRTRKN